MSGLKPYDNAGLKGAAQIAAQQVASTKNVRIKPDIVERLRQYVENIRGVKDDPPEGYLCWQAADEIERLRGALDTEKRWNATLEITARKDAEQARNAALEEAAQVFDEGRGWQLGAGMLASIRSAIRALLT